jgi:hypothetical protein
LMRHQQVQQTTFAMSHCKNHIGSNQGSTTFHFIPSIH